MHCRKVRSTVDEVGHRRSPMLYRGFLSCQFSEKKSPINLAKTLENLLDKYPVSWISSRARASPGRAPAIQAYNVPIKISICLGLVLPKRPKKSSYVQMFRYGGTYLSIYFGATYNQKPHYLDSIRSWSFYLYSCLKLFYLPCNAFKAPECVCEGFESFFFE